MNVTEAMLKILEEVPSIMVYKVASSESTYIAEVPQWTEDNPRFFRVSSSYEDLIFKVYEVINSK